MKYLRITSPDINNGEGCRVTLWIPGCTHKCKGCHNTWTAAYNQGMLFTEETYEELYDILSKPFISGLTLSGGDPLCQSESVLYDILCLVQRVKKDFPNKTIWVYTGYYYEELNYRQKEILKHCDVLIDGPFIESLRDVSLEFRGSSNQRIIKLK